MKKVLWIDSGAEDLAEFTVPVRRQYELQTALTISEALRFMSSTAFDAVITEVYVEVGSEDRQWLDFYYSLFHGDRRRTFVERRLGLCFLYALFAPQKVGAPNGLPSVHRPDWCQPDRFGIFSTDSDSMLAPYIMPLHLAAVKEKPIEEDEKQLLRFVEQVLAVEPSVQQ